jgi:hypothetical protein
VRRGGCGEVDLSFLKPCRLYLESVGPHWMGATLSDLTLSREEPGVDVTAAELFYRLF